MKHINVCKPSSQEKKDNKHQNDGTLKNQNASATKRGLKILIFLGLISITLSCNKGNKSISSNNINPSPNANPVSCGTLSEILCDVLKLVNQERTTNGFGTLGVLSTCVQAAQFHADDMATLDYFSHDSPTETWLERMTRYGLNGSSVAENIAMGQNSATDVMTSWMNSPGHKANILNANYQSIGIGLATRSDGTKLWVQCFSGLMPDQ